MEEEEDKEAGVTDGQEEVARLSLSGAAQELGGSHVQESPSGENGSHNERNSHNVSNHIDNAERQFLDRDTVDQNGDLDKCELSLR